MLALQSQIEKLAVPPEEPVIDRFYCDATFVDDEAIVITAKTPAALDHAILHTIRSVFRIFGLLHLDIISLPGRPNAS